ncbi:MAG: PIN domain-containing protein [Gammaproteobacteria bacterium HGW-Gammaproteobacteria-4]|jgi:hypothetical protein|nr:MAG: PIN domain-containing protein [Gammaproteobacteria bacterium HGW-Gammaproteobacteria-4]
MPKKRVYVDSCVLIAAFKAFEGDVSDAALAALDDPAHELLYSRIVELEVMPKPTFQRKSHECDFYKAVFESATRVCCAEQTIDRALDQACLNNLSAGDALHVACAMDGGADELLTFEKRTKLPSAPHPGVPIRTLRSD